MQKWEQTAIKLINEGSLKIFYTKTVNHPIYQNIAMFKCKGCNLPVLSTSSWYNKGYQWHYSCLYKD